MSILEVIEKIYLDHPWMVSWVISRPRSAISHGPSLFRYFLRFRYKGIDPYLELFILPLSGKKELRGSSLATKALRSKYSYYVLPYLILTFIARLSFTKVGCTLSFR